MPRRGPCVLPRDADDLAPHLGGVDDVDLRQRPCLELEEAIRLTKDRLTVDPTRRTERTRQAFTGLVSSGVLGCNEGWVWLR